VVEGVLADLVFFLARRCFGDFEHVGQRRLKHGGFDRF
jgi:hypothetical protein